MSIITKPVNLIEVDGKTVVLTDKQLAFVRAWVRTGNPVLAAEMAGYSCPPVDAWRLRQLPHVMLARNHEAQLFNDELEVKAMARLGTLMDSDNHAAAVRACGDVLALVKPQRGAGSGKEPHEMSADELAAERERLEQELAGRAKPVDADSDTQPTDIFG